MGLGLLPSRIHSMELKEAPDLAGHPADRLGYKNPFNGIERSASFRASAALVISPGIHSMELKVSGFRDSPYSSSRTRIHSMELKAPHASVPPLTEVQESIQWN